MSLEWHNQNAELTARLLTQDLAVIGCISCVERFDGWALLDSGVMFGFVDQDNVVFLRASELSALRFATLGATKHQDMPYWTVPVDASTDLGMLRDLAYEAADAAHLAVADQFSSRVAELTHPTGKVPLSVVDEPTRSDDSEITLTLPRVKIA